MEDLGLPHCTNRCSILEAWKRARAERKDGGRTCCTSRSRSNASRRPSTGACWSCASRSPPPSNRCRPRPSCWTPPVRPGTSTSRRRSSPPCCSSARARCTTSGRPSGWRRTGCWRGWRPGRRTPGRSVPSGTTRFRSYSACCRWRRSTASTPARRERCGPTGWAPSGSSPGCRCPPRSASSARASASGCTSTPTAGTRGPSSGWPCRVRCPRGTGSTGTPSVPRSPGEPCWSWCPTWAPGCAGRARSPARSASRSTSPIAPASPGRAGWRSPRATPRTCWQPPADCSDRSACNGPGSERCPCGRANWSRPRRRPSRSAWTRAPSGPGCWSRSWTG